MNDKRVHGKIQDPNKRINNFDEVELGFTHEEALMEANRCLQCKNPRCVTGCPVNIRIPEFIKCIKEDNVKGAYEVISEDSSLPSVCGRVCPQERQCEGSCIKGIKGDAISIGALERYVADEAIKNGYFEIKDVKKNGKKVAIVGSGPAGITCASELVKNGFDVTIYEVLHKTGGVLTYGIPEFRLPKEIVKKEVDNLIRLGVKIITDTPVGNQFTIEELRKEYDAVFLATGAGIPKFMGIEGENANQVFSANEILTRVNLMGSYKSEASTPVKKGHIAYVIGGGNVAMDAVRTLRRLGYEAHLMYRRGEEELPARRLEVSHAKEEGVIFDLLRNPVKILTDENNNVTGMEVIKMSLSDVGSDGRKNIEKIENSNYNVKCDMVVMALGTLPNHEALKESDIELSDKGLIVVDNTKTSLDNVYAGGDATSGSATVILAMEAGKNAAKEIKNNLLNIKE